MFLKAVGSELNDRSPDIFRHEIASLRRLPDGPWRPRLLSWHDDGDWVAMLLQDIEGRQPERWTPSDVRLVFDALIELGDALRPVSWPQAPRLVTREGFDHWERLSAAPPADLPRWTQQRLDQLVELDAAARTAVEGDALAHCDIRRDNLLITEDDTVVFVDWSWTSHAADWADVLLTAVDVPASGSNVDPDEVLADHPRTRDLDPYALTACIAGFAGMLTAVSREPAPPGLPTIRAYQRPLADILLEWTRRRMGW